MAAPQGWAESVKPSHTVASDPRDNPRVEIDELQAGGFEPPTHRIDKRDALGVERGASRLDSPRRHDDRQSIDARDRSEIADEAIGNRPRGGRGAVDPS